MKTTTILTKFFKERTGLLELILVAVIIGFSIELISAAFLNILNLSNRWNLLIGVALLILGSLYFVYRIYNLKKSQFHVSGFVSYLKEKKLLVPVSDYRFGEDLSGWFLSAINENEAIMKQWKAEPLESFFLVTKDGEQKITNPKSHQLIVQLTEYFILKSLSTHLSGHFNHDNFSQDNLVTFERKNIPQILFENIFLELFSKPMEQRPAFVDDTVKDKKIKSTGKIIASFKDGFRFEHFELTLPKGSKIKREKKNEIKIETPRINLTFKIDFKGFNSNLPVDFEKYYLGIDGRKEITYYQLDIYCNIDFKLKTFITNSGWDYFTWIDTFIEKLEEDISKERFLEKINWKTAKTMIKVLKNITQEKDRNKIEDAEVIDDLKDSPSS
jgi:hypothetical protein